VWVPLSIMVTTVFVRLAGSQVTVKVSALVAFITILPCVLFMVWGVKDIDAAAFVKTAGVPCIPPVASLCDRHASPPSRLFVTGMQAHGALVSTSAGCCGSTAASFPWAAWPPRS
jgi:hypothetical protein